MLVVSFVRRNAPGVALCGAIACAAYGLQHAEQWLLGHAYAADLVLAILLGVVVRVAWLPSARYRPGMELSARVLLEIAVALLGASVSLQALASAGPALVLGIAGVVTVTLLASYAVGRTLGLRWRMALLVACGNSICGNSAIAAVAPIIGAEGKDIAPAISFTAVLGLVVVLVLPLLAPALSMSDTQYGVFAGLTVYAVPQVIAATAPVGALSGQVGTLVKLVRVLMIGPVVLLISLGMAHRSRRRGERAGLDRPGRGFSFRRYVPWFIVAFLGLAGLRSLGLIPEVVVSVLLDTTTVLALISMAALGLDVDLREAARMSARVSAAVSASLLMLLLISLALLRLLDVP